MKTNTEPSPAREQTAGRKTTRIWQLAAAAAVLILLLFAARQVFFPAREVLLTGIWINENEAAADTTALTAQMEIALEADVRRQTVRLESGFAASPKDGIWDFSSPSRLKKLLSGGQLDFIVTDEDTAAALIGAGRAASLASFFTPAEQASLAGRMESADGLFGYALDLTGARYLPKNGPAPQARLFLIAKDAPHPEAVRRFLEFVLPDRTFP